MKRHLTALACLIAFGAAPALADDPVVVELTIKDHRFEPSELKVPAGTPFVIRVKNLDSTAEEFESNPLKVEKVIAGQGEAKVRNRGLKPGRYEFFGEFHKDTAQGVLIAE